MRYKTELHCHTMESSLMCGKVAAKDIVDMYIAAGYSTLFITDHYGGQHISGKGSEYDVEVLLRGYRAAAEAAVGKDIHVILGIEVNLCGSKNDYLLYGVTEEFIRQNPEMYKLSLPDFVKLAHDNGMLVYQAHPFRNGMTVMKPNIVDGIEVFNGHPKHDARNDLAALWADKFGMKKISGSDGHRPHGMLVGGITTDTPIRSAQDLLSVLASEQYELITVEGRVQSVIINSKQYDGLCSCGKEHKMQTVFSVIERRGLFSLNTYMKDYGLDGFSVAVYDENTYRATADRHPTVDLEVILPSDNLHANEHGVALLMDRLPEEVGVLIAIGSGTVHDITRYCAYKRGVDFVSCPTAASVDGFCSSVAVMTWHGCKKTLTAVAPKIVVADLDIIKNAPIRMARSGYGDMVGKFVALTDWKIAHMLKDEFYCERIADMTMQATKAVMDSAQGMLVGDEAAYANLMYGLLLSGLAMQMMGNSRPASGAEHHISHCIEMQPPMLGVSSDALHGEKVGVGTLLVMEEYSRLCERDPAAFKDYERYTEARIAQVFGEEMTDGIVDENRDDAAVGISAQVLRENWAAICEIIRQMPPVEQLRAQYESLGVKSTLADIDVPEDKKQLLYEISPMVRNRLTLMRLRKCL